MSLSNILGGVLQGVGQGYHSIQEENRKTELENIKALREGHLKIMLDNDSPPSVRQAHADAWLATFGKKVPPQMQQLAQHAVTQGASSPPIGAMSPPPPVAPPMEQIGIPDQADQARPLERPNAVQVAAAPPPAPSNMSATPPPAVEVPALSPEEFMQKRGILFPRNISRAQNPDDWNYYWIHGGAESPAAQYKQYTNQLDEEQRQQNNANAADARKQAADLRKATALESLIPILNDPNVSRQTKIARGVAKGFTSMEMHDMLSEGAVGDPEIVKEYNFAKTQGYKGTLLDWIKAKKDSDKLLSPEEEAQRIRIARSSKEGNEGTWTLNEDAQGNPIWTNNKTREVQPATNVEPKGTAKAVKAEYQKNVEPVIAANDFAQKYLASGKYTGPSDESLQEKFFELAKPSTGFRMTQPQMNMLQQSRDWRSSIEAKVRHATVGTWFSDEQRKQIVNTMNDLAKAKMSARSAGPAASAPPAPTGATKPPTMTLNGTTFHLQPDGNYR